LTEPLLPSRIAADRHRCIKPYSVSVHDPVGQHRSQRT